MSEPFIGQISPFGFNFAPRGWAMCNGQLLPISQNTALFSLLGTTYGGNGQTTFALPDLRSRVPIHFGQGAGLSNYDLGQTGGVETVTLTNANLPPLAQPASTQDPNVSNPANNVPALGSFYQSSAADTALRGLGGGNQPHENIQPYLAINFCIALEGIFPSRN